jgi:hypothetical protein
MVQLAIVHLPNFNTQMKGLLFRLMGDLSHADNPLAGFVPAI